MATWGEFISEIAIQKSKTGGMVVSVDDAITLWEERNQLAQEVMRLREELAGEREACAREVDDFADAIAAEPDQPEYLVPVLRAAANLIRERGQAEAEAAEEESGGEAPETPEGEPQ